MEKFVDRIAAHIFDEKYELRDLVIVLPSQRAKKYLQRALFNRYQKPIFSPLMITMDRWVKSLVDTPVIDSTRGLFKLYSVHQQVATASDKGLDEFIKWGKTLLNDFDEIDRYLIESKQLFRNLADIKELENWSFNSEEELTPAQKRFMEFWDTLPKYYDAYNALLQREGETYMGKVYKTVATEIDLAFKNNKNARFIFAGFNALSAAELQIMKQLERMGRAKVFIDADTFYLHNQEHEAGSFLRHLMNELQDPKMSFVTDKLTNGEKEISIINCAQPTGQAKVSSTLLVDEIPANEQSETLLLLADEQLIVPVIKNIPAVIQQTNITLGLPLKHTAIRSWVDLVFKIQENYAQFKTKSIYHKDFIRFIKHPFVIAFISEEDKLEIGKIEQNIMNNNWLFIHPKSLKCSEEFKALLTLTFEPWNSNTTKSLQNLRQLNKTFYAKISTEKNALEKAVLYHFDQSLVKLENVLSEFKPVLHLVTFKNLFNQHWINESVAYYGNPLEGLQVMGLLETRLLDFKNIIIVGLNDGKMPPDNPIQTLIPMDLRRFHQLPTPREKQGLFAHHVYRLFHHAKRVWITYSSASGDFGMDEPSRYIQQLKLELARVNTSINLKESYYTLSDEQQDSSAISVPKTAPIIERLDDYFLNKTSASALRTYMNCPLDFYYKYILGFGEEDTVEEEIEASTFGSFIHNTFEELYRPYARYDKQEVELDTQPKPVSAHSIAQMKNKSGALLKKDFEDHYKNNKEVLLTGKNYLSYEIANHLTLSFLKQEESLLKKASGHLFIESLESSFERTLKVTVKEEEKTIHFRGIIDRIDRLGGELRLLDYKTGTCDESKVKIAPKRGVKDPIEALKMNLNSSQYAFQLLMYNFLYFGKYQRYPQQTGIISLVNIKEGPFYLKNTLTRDLPSLMELFEQALIEIIAEIYDTAQPFEHNIKSLYCKYCH